MNSKGTGAMGRRTELFSLSGFETLVESRLTHGVTLVFSFTLLFAGIWVVFGLFKISCPWGNFFCLSSQGWVFIQSLLAFLLWWIFSTLLVVFIFPVCTGDWSPSSMQRTSTNQS